ncbi:MAG: hypothetical protein JWL79_3803 [Frankiales bacterium]|nr:hypothetical protein [Frankiales bacterium]
MSRRRVRSAALAAGALTVFGVLHAAASPSPASVRLKVGADAFWNGAYVQSAATGLVGSAACAVEACYSYPIQVGVGGSLLRVAIDTPDRANEFELDLLDPSGKQVTSAANTTQSQFDMEVYAQHPVAGTWTARVVPQYVTNAGFRLRAKLEGKPTTYAKKTELLPNLEVTPPYEFTFVAPANPANVYAPDSANPPLSVLGIAPLSCTPDETIGLGPSFAPSTTHVTRCLRFTTGPRDAGPGPFVIAYNPSSAQFGVLNSGQAYQRVYYSDGTSYLRKAGEFRFHAVHGHYHYNGFLNFQLYRVGASHSLTPAGSGNKVGLCPADELFADWHVFNQQETTTFTANCGYSTGEASLGLNVGWGDVYRWQRPGQYVDFSGDGDGIYLLRVTVNASHLVKTVPNDVNTGYAYLRIIGSKVDILERGQGDSPWDARKRVFNDQ